MKTAGSLMDGIKVKPSKSMHAERDEAATAAEHRAGQAKSARVRLFVALAIFLAAGIVAAYTLWPRSAVDDSEPDARRGWMSAITPELQAWEYRAVNVAVEGELGKPGAKILFSGIVSNQAVLTGLKSKVTASAPPAPVDWKVEVGWVVGDDEKLMPANPR